MGKKSLAGTRLVLFRLIFTGMIESIREREGGSIQVNISRAIRNSVITTVPVAESTINYRKYFAGKLIFGSRRHVRAYD